MIHLLDPIWNNKRKKAQSVAKHLLRKGDDLLAPSSRLDQHKQSSSEVLFCKHKSDFSKFWSSQNYCYVLLKIILNLNALKFVAKRTVIILGNFLKHKQNKYISNIQNLVKVKIIFPFNEEEAHALSCFKIHVASARTNKAFLSFLNYCFFFIKTNTDTSILRSTCFGKFLEDPCFSEATKFLRTSLEHQTQSTADKSLNKQHFAY